MTGWFKQITRLGVSAHLPSPQIDELIVLNSFCVHGIFAGITFACLNAFLLSKHWMICLMVGVVGIVPLFISLLLNRGGLHVTAKAVFSFGLTSMLIFCAAYFGLDSDLHHLLLVVFTALIVVNKTNSRENLMLLFINVLMSSSSLLFLYISDTSYIELDEEEVRMFQFLSFAMATAGLIAIALINYAFHSSREMVLSSTLRQLGAQASMFRAVSDNIIGGMFRSTPNDGVVYANKDFLRLFALDSMEQALKMSPVAVYAHPEERERVISILESQGRIEQERVLFKRADGTTFWGSLTARLTLEDGKMHIDGTVMDISEQMQKERALIDRDEQLEEAQRLALIGSWQIDYREEKVKWSRQMFSIFEYDPEEPVPDLRAFLKLLAVDQMDEVIPSLETMAKRSSGPHTYDAWVKTKNGEAKFIKSKFYFESDADGIASLRGTVQDMTEHRLMEDKLTETKNFYERVLDYAPIEIVILDREKRFIFFNKKSLTDPELRVWLLGKTDLDFCEHRNLDPAFGLHRMEQYQKALDEESLISWEEVMKNRQGKNEYIVRNVFPLMRDKEGPTHLISFGFAVTSMREAQEILEFRNEELQKLNEELDRFVYSVSHDLRAPIASVLGLINIGEEVGTTEEAKEVFHMQRDALERLDTYIRDVIDHSRNKRLVVNSEHVDIHEMVEDIIDGLRFLPSMEKVKITTEVPDGLTVLTDAVRMKVALNNLLSNAIRYSDLSKEKPFVHLEAKALEGGVSIVVEDNGIGIRKEYQDKVWDMFFRGTTKSGGSGLGLYILKETIEKLGGTITLASEEGKGSAFRMTVPNKTSTSADPSAGSSQSPE